MFMLRSRRKLRVICSIYKKLNLYFARNTSDGFVVTTNYEVTHERSRLAGATD